MPLYTVSSRNQIPDTLKQQVAKVIMDTHCSLTGAPETFVNVIFSENMPLNDGIDHEVLAAVRKGRTPEMNKQVEDAQHQNLCTLLNIRRDLLAFSLMEVPAAWVMEGGKILPEPGEENQCEWLQQSHH